MIRLAQLPIFIGLSILILATTFSSSASENKLRYFSQLKPLKLKPDLSAFKDHLKPLKPSPLNRKISSRLNNLVSHGLETFDGRTAPDGMVSKVSDKERVKVILEITDNLHEVSNAIIAYEGRILRERGNLIAIEIPVDNIEDMVGAIDQIEYARLPYRFYPVSDEDTSFPWELFYPAFLRKLGVTSEGVNLTGAEDLHNAGFTGSGVKVAIIDIGFKGLTEARANRDIPDSVITYDFSGNGLETQYLHGTACAEIVHDMAPDAELHLLKISDEVDFYDVIEYCINNDIDIISYSLGTFGSGPGDGTGPVDEACDELKENGILFIAAAGNSANSTVGGLTYGAHWEGPFIDSDSDNRHDFSGPLYYFNPIGAYPEQDDDGNPETNEVTIVMRWNDDWPGADTDYDMYLWDESFEKLFSWSNYTQNGSEQSYPLEEIVKDIPDDEVLQQYVLVIQKKEGEPAGKEIEIYLGGTSMFIPISPYDITIATSSSSINEPADAQSVLAVGAINYENWTAGPQEDFSSQGPTNAWAGSSARIKPDICGPDGVSGYAYGTSPSYGPFYGTSAATPHVAGAAALILSMDPELSPDELQDIIESEATDMGTAGKDNIYGWGRLSLHGLIE
jgi:subtilisin family serine protease